MRPRSPFAAPLFALACLVGMAATAPDARAAGDAAAAATATAPLLQAWTAEAGRAPSAERGRAFFTASHGREWQCASCHTANPAQPGRHAATGRDLAPLAPAATPARLTDPAKVEKWLRRNCRDVVGRECTAGEKADVVSWLLAVKP